jgi:two-component system sensor histidine kinase UhpB
LQELLAAVDSSLWESHRWYFLTTLVILVAQVVLIAALLVQRARRRHAEEATRASEATVRRGYERIRQLAGRLINAQESARAGIAQDLHDDVSQHLVYLSMSVAALKTTPGCVDDPELQRALTDLEQDTRCVLDSIRRLSHELHPTTLRVLGLGPALQAHCVEVAKRHGVHVAFATASDFRYLNHDVALCLFRVAQESMRNGLVHGHAHQFTVTLSIADRNVCLDVTDNGSGFEYESARRRAAGLGLVTMEERVNVIGGDLHVVSEVGKGTTVHVRCPVDPPSIVAHRLSAGSGHDRRTQTPPVPDVVSAQSK